MQSVANVTGNTSLQTAINEEGVEALSGYYHSYTEFLALRHQSGDAGIRHSGWAAHSVGDLPRLLWRLKELVEQERRERGKEVELLLVSCFLARLMNGARTTSCKSAKDRTSMFHTLEVARLAELKGWLERYNKRDNSHGGIVLTCEMPRFYFNETTTKNLSAGEALLRSRSFY
jgi:inositol polyphosphate-4-phosphatase